MINGNVSFGTTCCASNSPHSYSENDVNQVQISSEMLLRERGRDQAKVGDKPKAYYR